MNSTREGEPASVFRSTQALFAAACLLVMMAGISLYVFSAQTDQLFAWTVDPPLTAAAMGAAYFSAMILQLGAVRDRSWRRAGAILPGILVFTVLTLVATIIHIDKFHLDTAIGWIWVSIYVLFPPFGLAALINQRLKTPPDTMAATPIPATARKLAALQAAGLGAFGIALFLIPATSSQMWPWTLTPLTARAIGAWLIGMGVTAAFEFIRNDRGLSQILAYGKIALVTLLLIALVRYPDDFSWESSSGWTFILALALLAGNALLVVFERKRVHGHSGTHVSLVDDENRTPRFP